MRMSMRKLKERPGRAKKLDINIDMLNKERSLDINAIKEEIKDDKKEYNEGENKKVILGKKPLIIPEFEDIDLLTIE